MGGCADEYTVEERKLFEIWGEIRNEYKLPDINESYNIENIIHNSIKLINNSKNEQLIKDIHKKLQKFRKHDFLSIKRFDNIEEDNTKNELEDEKLITNFARCYIYKTILKNLGDQKAEADLRYVIKEKEYSLDSIIFNLPKALHEKGILFYVRQLALISNETGKQWKKNYDEMNSKIQKEGKDFLFKDLS